MVEILCLVDDCCGSYNATIVIDENIAHYRENPSLEIGVVDIFAFVVKGFQDSVLKEIVSVVSIGSEHIGKVKKVALEAHKLVLKFLSSHNHNIC